MPLSQQQADRLNRGIELLVSGLNANAGPGYTPQDLPFRVCKMSERHIAFGISHRAPIGQRHPSGQKWATYPGPTIADCELIAQTAHSDEEVVTAFRRCVFEGIRPMRSKTGQILDEAAINKIVQDRLAPLQKMLDDKIAELARQQLAAAATVPETEPPNTAVTSSPAAPSKRLLDTWTERAATLGMDGPKLLGNGRIDGRWMRHAQQKWAAHKQQQPTT